RARPSAGGARVRRGCLFDRRHRDLAVGVAVRVADRRPQPVPQREALVRGDRQPAGGEEGLQGAEGRRRDSHAVAYNRLVRLSVAVAVFMENMDSTVIATSLPAIAAAIGTNPLALKLAVTSYLLSLAVFIPASGWIADRFGARTVFRAAIAVFVLGSIGCAVSDSLTDFVIARIGQGFGGAMMSAGERLG